MVNQWAGPRLIIASIFASSTAAYAGMKHIHNMDVKAQCIAKADEENLTGHERHVAVKQCIQDGSFLFHRY
jgi:hypothetical protein